MRYQNREKMYDVNVWELKKFVLEVASYYQLKQLHKSILLTCCLDELRDLISSNSVFHHMVLKRLMLNIESETNACNIEQHLIYMRLLLNWNNPQYQHYRQRLFDKLKNMMNPYLTSDLYILMRHLLNKVSLVKLIDSFNLNYDELQKYFLCEIYLIEEDYKMAYTYLKECRYVGVLQEYDYELRNYSYLKYKKYILKEPFFNLNPLGDIVWMKNQLKY